MNIYDPVSSVGNATSLDLEAIAFSRQKSLDRLTTEAFCIFDFEYAYDIDSYDAYRRADDADGEYRCKWPFHYAVAGGWALITYPAGALQPIVHNVSVYDARTHDEVALVTAFFGLLDRYPDAVPVGWGSECKEMPTLRRTAATHGLVLPKRLRDSHPYSRDRIDLSNTLKGQGHFVHMPEYAHATGIPAKPIASKAIGKAVENGNWDEVREQVLADVVTTAIIANRYLISGARVSGDVYASDAAIFAELAAAYPQSQWLNLHNRGWDMHRLGQACRGGKVAA
jgi:hypothetical protein